MKINEVPQDDANLFEGKTRDVQYALDENGKYTTVKSVGWEPKNIAMTQAWELEKQKREAAWIMVKEGKKSPIYYHMVRCLMDIKLVAAYTGFSRWKVRRHFRPLVFSKLTVDVLNKYVYTFGLTAREDLSKSFHHED